MRAMVGTVVTALVLLALGAVFLRDPYRLPLAFLTWVGLTFATVMLYTIVRTGARIASPHTRGLIPRERLSELDGIAAYYKPLLTGLELFLFVAVFGSYLEWGWIAAWARTMCVLLAMAALMLAALKGAVETRLTHFDAEDEHDAERELDLLRHGNPSERVAARNRLGRIFERRGLVSEAAECYESNVRAGVRDAGLYARLAHVYRLLGETGRADQADAEAAKLRRPAQRRISDVVARLTARSPVVIQGNRLALFVALAALALAALTLLRPVPSQATAPAPTTPRVNTVPSYPQPSAPPVVPNWSGDPIADTDRVRQERRQQELESRIADLEAEQRREQWRRWNEEVWQTITNTGSRWWP